MATFLTLSAASARRLDQHRKPVRGEQAPYGRARVEAFREGEKRPLVTLPYGPLEQVRANCRMCGSSS